MQYEKSKAGDHQAGANVLGVFIHAISWSEIMSRIGEWSARRESRAVCVCNVHSVVAASRDAELAEALRSADVATPDGAPVAWMLRRLGFPRQRRISGPDLMERYCELAAQRKERVFLYGSTELVLRKLAESLRHEYPGIVIAGAISPPFHELTPAEDRQVVDAINTSGAGTVWVGLGCPKQELWMAAHRGQVHAVMIGVGAAFDFIAGTTDRAPRWMQRSGLEWAFRWMSEPRRLTKRYAVTNTLFVIGAFTQLGSNLLRRRS